MYAGVPSIVPERVSQTSGRFPSSPTAPLPASPSASPTSPKSVTRARPSTPTSTLSGLKSRCTRPARCTAWRPRPASTKAWRISAFLPRRSSQKTRSVRPSTHSITTSTSSPEASTSCTVTTLGCLSLAIACASRTSRARAAPSPERPAWRERSTLIATSRPSVGSRARTTSPTAPSPSFPVTSKRPSLAPGKAAPALELADAAEFATVWASGAASPLGDRSPVPSSSPQDAQRGLNAEFEVPHTGQVATVSVEVMRRRPAPSAAPRRGWGA